MDSKSVSLAISKFSARFFNELNKNKNVVSSPLSAEFLLALLTLATTDPAHSELLTSLGLADDDSIRTSFSTVSSKLKSIKVLTFNIANKVYIMEGSYDLHPKLKNDAAKIFDAAMEKINFSDNVAAVNNINSWVATKTNNKIKNLFETDAVNGETSLVLVNALYFKGTWKIPFPPSNTHNQTFKLSAKSTVEMPMMYIKEDYSYGFSDHLKAELLQLPYHGDEASLLIVLPKEIEGLNGVISKLAAGHDLMSDVKKNNTIEVQVTIPKFTIETEIDLNKILPKLGINAIFQQGNSGITKLLTSEEPLFVSKAVQKAFIEINEEGTEAAAATGAKMVLRCGRPSAPDFRADRPFLYMLLGADQVPVFFGAFRGIS